MSKTSNACDKSASHEDKMREEFEENYLTRWRGSKLQFERDADGEYTDSGVYTDWLAWKDCAAIKDAEIVKERQLCTEYIEQRNDAYKEIAARDLMIKELQCILHKLACLGNGKTYGNSLGNEIAQKALAKSEHHDYRALEKMLLGAELKGLNTYDDSDYFKRKDEVIAKLAELNKE